MSFASIRTLIINICLSGFLVALVVYVWRDIPPQPIMGFTEQRFEEALQSGAIQELSYQGSSQQIFGRMKPERRSEFGGDEFHIPARLTLKQYEEIQKSHLSGQRFLGAIEGLDKQSDFDKALGQVASPVTHTFLKPGEKATYNLTVLGMSLGQLSMEILPSQNILSRPALHFLLKAETSSSFAGVYRANDSAEAFVDPQSLSPLAFAMRINESERFGGIFEIQLTPDKLSRWTQLVTKTAGLKTQKQELIQHRDVHNFVSLIYAIRAQDWSQAHRFQLNDQNKEIEVNLTPKGEQTLHTARGPLEAYLLEPTIKIAGEAKNAPPIQIWIQKQEPHLLLQMQADLKIGKIRALIAN